MCVKGAEGDIKLWDVETWKHLYVSAFGHEAAGSRGENGPI